MWRRRSGWQQGKGSDRCETILGKVRSSASVSSWRRCTPTHATGTRPSSCSRRPSDTTSGTSRCQQISSHSCFTDTVHTFTLPITVSHQYCTTVFLSSSLSEPSVVGQHLRIHGQIAAVQPAMSANARAGPEQQRCHPGKEGLG